VEKKKKARHKSGIERGFILPAAVEIPAPVKTTILFLGPFFM
jgi:hypothetical protein